MNEELLKEWEKDPDGDYWLVWNPRALSFWWCKIKLENIEWLKGGSALQMPIARIKKSSLKKI